jgi:hypothetical protein
MEEYMQHNNKKAQPTLRLTVLAMSLCAVNMSAHALQAMDESALRAVNAQDGLMLDTQYDSLNIDKLYWEDKTGVGDADTAVRAYANNIAITGSNLGTTYKINAGSDTGTGKAGLDFSIESRYGTVSADSFALCDGAGNNCGDSIGGLTVQSTENAVLHFITKDGLFSPTSLSSAEISLKRVNIFLTQLQSAGLQNQLIFKDFNFNFKGQGYMYVDPTAGLIIKTGLDGYGTLDRVCELNTDCSGGLTAANSKPGLNIDIVTRSGASDFDITPSATKQPKGMIRIGASGYLPSGEINIRGTDGRDAAGDAILGKTYSASDVAGTANIMGSTGLAMRVQAKFSNANTVPSGQTATTLELGHGGNNAYALSFSNFTPLLVRKQDGGGTLNIELAYFDSGNVYVNLANTKRMLLPQNTVLNDAPFLAGNLTTANDYSQQIHGSSAANPNSVIIATRGTEFQAISRQTQFIASPDVYKDGITANDPVSGGSWGLGLPFYNLNSNLAIYGTKFTGTPYGAAAAVTDSQRLGFALAMSTEGVSADGSKTTSIMLLDGKKYGQTLNAATGLRNEDAVNGDPINYYMGIRNIDMLLTGRGSIGMENGNINIDIPQFMLAAAGEVAVGYLPGSQYKTHGKGYAPIDGFLSVKDVLFGLRLRMAGSVDMSMIPGGNTLASNYIQFLGNMNLTNGAVQIVDAVDGSIIGLDDMSGRIAFNNDIKIHKDSVNFNTQFNINPNKQAAEVLRVKSVNLYPSIGGGNVGNAQRLGEMVFTGGRITSQLNITPH